MIQSDPKPSSTKAWIAAAIFGLLIAGLVTGAYGRPLWFFAALTLGLTLIFRVGIAWRQQTGEARDTWTMRYKPLERINYDPPESGGHNED